MTETKGQAISNLYTRMKQHNGCIKRAAEIAGVSVNWVRTIVRDLKYENEAIVKACIQALKEFEEKSQAGLNVSEDYISRMTDLITKNLNNGQASSANGSISGNNGKRHSAVAG